MIPRPNLGKTDSAVQIALRCPQELYERLRESADKEHRPLANYIVHLLTVAGEKEIEFLTLAKGIAAETIAKAEGQNKKWHPQFSVPGRVQLESVTFPVTDDVRKLADKLKAGKSVS